jgi:hypothetical protein
MLEFLTVAIANGYVGCGEGLVSKSPVHLDTRPAMHQTKYILSTEELDTTMIAARGNAAAMNPSTCLAHLKGAKKEPKIKYAR